MRAFVYHRRLCLQKNDDYLAPQLHTFHKQTGTKPLKVLDIAEEKHCKAPYNRRCVRSVQRRKSKRSKPHRNFLYCKTIFALETCNRLQGRQRLDVSVSAAELFWLRYFSIGTCKSKGSWTFRSRVHRAMRHLSGNVGRKCWNRFLCKWDHDRHQMQYLQSYFTQGGAGVVVVKKYWRWRHCTRDVHR